MMRRIAVPLTAAGALLALPAVAGAHVSLHPNVVPAGANAVLTLRVPDESDSASTVGVAVRLPAGFLDAAVDPPPGWSVRLVRQRLAHPVRTSDGTVTEQVREIVLTGDRAQGRIAPGQFAQFPISVQMPDVPRHVLSFKVLQSYSDGQVDRWIGPEGSDSPAATVAVPPAGGPILDLAGSESGPPASAAQGVSLGPADPAGSVAAAPGGSDALRIAAAVLAGLGLLVAAAALELLRRARREPRPRRTTFKEAW